MACLIVPASEALVVTVVSKVMERKIKRGDIKVGDPGYTRLTTLLSKRKWLTNLLWGGSALLAFEHVWHGEIVPWFPFLTAAYSAEETAAMLREMATAGVAMAVLVTIVWIGMVLFSLHAEKTEAAKNCGASL